MIYLDSCAIVKLIAPEAETASFTAWLNERSDEWLVTSMLSEVEVPRALRRTAPRVLGRVTNLLAQLGRFEVDAPAAADAGCRVGSPGV